MAIGNVKTVFVFGAFAAAGALGIIEWWLCIPGFVAALAFAFLWEPQF